MSYAIGVDLGGTHLRAALVDRDGNILAHQRIKTLAHEGPDAVIGRILNLVGEVRSQHGNVEITGVGIAAPGPLDPKEGVVITAPNLAGWNNVALKKLVGDRLDVPVVIGNDANLAAVGEWKFGGGRGMRNLIYVTISTGIGGGMIVDGHMLLGHRGLAAEVGHMVLQYDGPTSGSAPTKGSWEALASGTAIARDAAEAMRSGQSTMLNELTSPDQVSTHHIQDAAEQHDVLAMRLIEQAGRWCGVGFVTLLHLFSPEAIFIGGGVSNLGDMLLMPARQEIESRALPGYRETPLILTHLGDSIGLLGAAAYVFSECDPAISL